MARDQSSAIKASDYFVAVVLLLVLWPISSGNAASQRISPVGEAIGQILASPAVPKEADDREHWNSIRQLYIDRDLNPVWLSGDKWTKKARRAYDALQLSSVDGLIPRDYIGRLKLSDDPERSVSETARSEILLTAAMMRYIRDIRHGRVRSFRLGRNILAEEPSTDLDLKLAQGLRASHFDDWLEELAPKTASYVNLRSELARLRARLELERPSPVPDSPLLKRGVTHPHVETLRNRLAHWGDMNSAALESEEFDASLEKALLRFQARHALAQTGQADAQTLVIINRSYDQFVDQLIVNMERQRWMPEKIEEKYIAVNIPSQELSAIDDGDVVFTSRVIVGRTSRPTPVLFDEIVGLVLWPSWHVPPSMARHDILPKVKRDPGYLERNHFSVFLRKGNTMRTIDARDIDWMDVTPSNLIYSFVQKPGHFNALGELRFTLTNSLHIFMHSTNRKDLFEREDRCLSSGCVRIDKARELAKFAIKNNAQIDENQLDQFLRSVATKQISLNAPIPVYLTYMTAWIDKKGVLQIRDDVYRRDEKLSKALSRGRQQNN